MPYKSKGEMEELQVEFLQSNSRRGINPERILNCVVASFFNRQEVGALVNALNTNYIKVFLVLKENGEIGMGMAGADFGGIDPDSMVIPTRSVYPSNSPFLGENGLLSEIDCPPRCQKDNSKENNLVIINKNLLGPIS